MYENVKLNRNNEAKTFIHKQNRAANYIIALFPLLKKEKKKRKKKGGLLYRQTLLNHLRLHCILYQRHISPHLEPLRLELALDDQKTSAVS